jgi:hypothetical protein
MSWGRIRNISGKNMKCLRLVFPAFYRRYFSVLVLWFGDVAVFT